ncbi:cytochrome-c oxidase, cbb3-type subunit III [Siccirubricoccus sp. KC 17139]|uniref:Cbb3-type cytochrome c oxidase subunit n=1 Tax=Siccirubricoccus soli TaxID=2899147 RepID=A0ABT1DA80_9PROT|nr:cytochrome-c oxidase, cbb3-type subunit III [Siccirubricoccus soli]MCO6417900.1 cytochrome-c oxidase, cbb3-type subunit III [Siccirubricoccus soli]MCP2684035.1 cytochrome-c oxidase, cbb3-type subunit III [Siccirubricoccus soli]
MANAPERDAHSGTTTTGHEWDGLKELNTPLPTWWLWTFYATIAFSLLWLVLYPALPFTGTGLLGSIARQEADADHAARIAAAEPMLARLRQAELPEILADAELRAYAIAGGRTAFGNSCAGCHGAGGQGAAGGFPSLADDDWLWGGRLAEIEQTIRHGIRAPDDAETRLSQMPRFLADGMLTAAQVGDVAEHVLSLSGRGTDAAAAARGASLFAENCVACHGERGEGNRELGAPSLADAVWLYGGDRASVARSISYARAGVMPAWGARLDPAVIRMLVVYLHSLGGTEGQ